MNDEGRPADWRADPLTVLDAVVAGFDGERRDGQRELARAVEQAMRDRTHLVAEAPTGSGKSLAYLAPAVASGLKVVVATSTKALQSQLMAKDLPALAEYGGVPFTFAVMKGRANYICRAKLRTAARPDALFEQPVSGAFAEHLRTLERFAQRTEFGDRAELTESIPDASWAAVSCTATECPGQMNCSDGAECFVERARAEARDVDVLVVNHALYCSNVNAGEHILPPHDLVIIDEAHAFPENATTALGADLAPGTLDRLGAMLTRNGVKASAVDGLAVAAKALDALVGEREGRLDVAHDGPLASALLALAEALATANTEIGKVETDPAKRTARLTAARLKVARRLGAPEEDDVVWVEKGRRGSARIKIAPVAVGDLVGRVLLDQRPVIAVSATLGGAAPFAAFAAQIGLGREAEREYVALQAPSSFDWRDQGMLYVGRDLPDPGRARDAWVEESGERLTRLVNAAGGRALVLCTSRANVKQFAEVLRAETTHDILEQGEADTGQLMRTFVDDEASVLVGTRSFWAGIDAPGVACVLVVIDRIPFPSPGEPLQQARHDRAERHGLNPFASVDLPAAALVLAQGAGRLLRTRDDSGVVAVLDSRLALRDYRNELLTAMPPFRRSVDLDEACAFLEKLAAEAPATEKAPTVDLTAIRNAVECPTCGAVAGERCHDEGGFTMAFLHEERVAYGLRP